MTNVGTASFTYDDAGRLTTLQHKNGSGANLASYGYNYDSGNRLTTESLNGTAAGTYSYDRTNQLTSDGTNTYSYDKNGNRNMAGYQNGGDNEITNDGTWTYSYDAEANLTKKTKGASAETWYYGYDDHNHMTSARQEATDTGPTGTYMMLATYKFDALGRRIDAEVTQNSVTTVTHFAYDAETVWADLNSSNQLIERRISLDGLDTYFARVMASGAAGWFLTDHLASVRDITDNTGAIVDHLTYSVFGIVLSESSQANGDRIKWQGGEYDAERGFYHFDNRDHNPATGQWVQEDPSAFGAGDPNLRRDEGNDPINGTDPTGLYEEDVHFYMTYYIAHAMGIGDTIITLGLNGEEKEKAPLDLLIAWADQYVDISDRTRPVPPDPANAPAELLEVERRRTYHFRCKPGESVKPGSSEAEQIVRRGLFFKKDGKDAPNLWLFV
jgi:RHS repeat-associated protein